MKSIELFSGAGGLAMGLERAGFETVALFERDANACATLRLNRPAWNLIEGDVRNVDFTRHGPVDLVAGGPPCQPFSMGGKARGHGDYRDMFPQAVRAVRELRPRAFIFENVRGLLRAAFADYVEFIRLQLTYPAFPVSGNVDWQTNLHRLQRHHTSKDRPEELVYQVTINLADAADYGVPQRRHRVFFVGFRRDLNAGWSFPSPTHTQDDLIRAKYVSRDYWDEHRNSGLTISAPAKLQRKIESLRTGELTSVTRRWRTVRDALRGLPPPSLSNALPNHRFQSGARSYLGHTGSPLDEPAKALKAGDHGVPGGENMLRHADESVRYFTIRESARIQTFPDDYVFPGSWTESMRQLGNAVPVVLAQAVATSVAAKIVTSSRYIAHSGRPA
ncbi:MAG: DNA (cytosine-5-)-methyltransferase [Candidatus Didemnitutus sp.]|nr:DNA (cytosine-5-)-methyltransferase [Candidatus Didemnitutus sp.]